MALDVNTIADELQSCTPVDNEADAIDNFVDAFENYFYDSTVKGVSIVGGALSAPVSAMKSAMVGYSTAAIPAMVAGLQAFWGAVSGSAVSIWVTVPPLASVTPPPTLPALGVALAITGALNISSSATLEQATAAIAADIHAATMGAIAIDTTAPTPLTFPVL